MLKEIRLSITNARVLALSALLQEHGPHTMEELHRIITERAPKACDLTTVYRCLMTFQEVGLVERYDLGDGCARFEVRRSGESHHHHIICVRCKRIESVESCSLTQPLAELKRRGFSDIVHRLEFFAVCQGCAGS